MSPTRQRPRLAERYPVLGYLVVFVVVIVLVGLVALIAARSA